jgi:hypothetical protein
MPDNYKSVPFLAGISLLLITSVSIGAFVYSSLRADSTDQSTETAEDGTATSESFDGSGTESQIKAAPYVSPESESNGAGSNTNSTTGIPTGTYSKPPAAIKTEGKTAKEAIPDTSQSLIESFESSVDRNRAIQQKMDDSIDQSIPDYSTPSASNNYNDNQDNSLIKPLEDDSLLESSPSTTETPPLAPVTEPLSPSPVSPSTSSSPSQP